jgi:RNA polymerase sigma factor (sigma-70 family)
VEALYVQYRGLLLYVAARKFHVPAMDCEALVHEALMALLQACVRIENPKAWLVAAVCNASRAYWRTRARITNMEGARIDSLADTTDTFDAKRIEQEVLVRALVRRLRPEDREILRLHYYEQLTAAEIATRFQTTTGYAEKLIVIALRRARDIYSWLSTQPCQAPTVPAPAAPAVHPKATYNSPGASGVHDPSPVELEHSGRVGRVTRPALGVTEDGKFLPRANADRAAGSDGDECANLVREGGEQS